MKRRVMSLMGASLAALGLALFAGRASAACTLGKMAELPVTMTGMRPMVQAKINGADANFIADSGAFYSVITPATAAEYKLHLGVAPFGMTIEGVGGSVSDVSITTVKSFAFAGLTLSNVDFFVAGGEVGAGAAGVIGQNVFKVGDVEYDLANGAIRLWRPKDCDGAVLAYWAKTQPYSAMDIRWTTPLEPHTTGVAYLNGVKIRVMFDTGASTSILSLSAAKRAGMKPEGPGVTAAGFSSGVGRRMVKTWIAPFDSFKIGDEEIRNIRLDVGEDMLPNVDMLVGADFFLSHRIYVAMSQHKLYFTYNGGPVFNLAAKSLSQAAPDKPAETEKSAELIDEAPTDAAGFSRRGEAYVARRDFQHALADLDKACALEPGEARYAYQRGVAHLGAGQSPLALQDIDRALTLKPDFVPALLARAEFHLAAKSKDDVSTDLAAADKAMAREADQRLRLAGDYERAGQFAPALASFDTWIKAHPEDSKQPGALNGRCWTRAQLGQDLEKALADCNAALRMIPNAAGALDSRGLVYLRLGNLDKAITDYDASLALQPKLAWSLYGRGVARIKKGLTVEGEADIAAAAAIQPTLAADAKSRGIGL